MSGLDLNAVIHALQQALPAGKGSIPLHEPEFSGSEWDYVKQCLDTGWVSSAGRFVDRFETELAAYTGARYAVAVVNGTAALHICLKLASVQQGDEVLVPTLTFVATANAVTYCGAIPHFADSEESTLGLDPGKLSDYLADIASVRRDGCVNKRTGRRIKAVVPMHTFGHPVDLDPLMELCRRYQLILIEDAAESLGSRYKQKHTGNFGASAALSFNGNKIITTGGGGAILTNDDLLAKQAKHLATTARVPHQWSLIHDAVGYNYRMPNINAALGCAQLEKLPDFLGRKRKLAERYQQAFSGIGGIRFFTEPEHAHSNYWLNVLLLDEENSNARDLLLQVVHEKGILARPAWTPMHNLHMYQHCPRMDLTVAESLEKRIINIPSSAVLGTSNA